jgi:hypothetical protein
MAVAALRSSGRYFRLHVRSLEDLRLAMRPGATRAQAEVLWSLLSVAGVLTRNGSGGVTGLLTSDEWERWCDKAWRVDKANRG